jgi:hypothetical protein
MVQGKSKCPPDAAKPIGTGSEAAGQVEGSLKQRALIEEALTRLDREQREVLVALHYRKIPVSELAMHLNIPTGTVNTRALSALRAIHRFLNDSPGRSWPGPCSWSPAGSALMACPVVAFVMPAGPERAGGQTPVMSGRRPSR